MKKNKQHTYRVGDRVRVLLYDKDMNTGYIIKNILHNDLFIVESAKEKRIINRLDIEPYKKTKPIMANSPQLKTQKSFTIEQLKVKLFDYMKKRNQVFEGEYLSEILNFILWLESEGEEKNE